MKRFRAMWRACSILTFIVSSFLLLTLIIWIPRAAHAASLTSPRFQYKVQATSVQTTPTVDPTVTALQKEKLEHDTNWWWTNGVTLLTSLVSTIALVGGGLFAFVRWSREQQETEIHRREDRQTEREKRDEDRFQSVVEGLGSDNKATQVGAAITLRTFLRKDYEQFYSQVFDLAVAHLRLRQIDPDEAEPLDSLSQALITIFGESFPLVRNQRPQAIRQLDAARIHLDDAHLLGADLQQLWIPQASFKQADLRRTNFSRANLSGSNLRNADLRNATLRNTLLSNTLLSGAKLNGADLNRAKLNGADLSGAKLSGAKLSGTDLSGTDLSGTDLSGTDLSGAKLSGTDLSGAKLSGAKLSGAEIQSVKGLTQELLETCKAQGAIILLEETL